ncbi:MAG: HDIG domain-containing protein, partial [archaeon]|nr:HDIG domain-containing protein [archaeon]
MSTIPDESECFEILKEAGCKNRVIIHCCTVKVVAEEMTRRISCNKKLVTAGAMLHDLGRAKDHSIRHAHVGAEIASSLGLPYELVCIIRKHTGAGLNQQDVKELGLPPGDYMPKTIEEKIVAHADNMVSDNTVVNHMHSVEKLMAKGANRGAQKIVNLHLELSKMYGEDLDIIVNTLGEHPNIGYYD